MSVEGVHFRRDWLTPREIGWRAAAAALSDLAAIAARPIGILVSLGLPKEDAGDFAVEVMEGCREAAEYAGGTLLGGDLARSPGPLVVDVTVVGEAPQSRAALRRPPRRRGVGHGRAGRRPPPAWRRCWRGKVPHPAARERFAHPVPRVREAQWLLGRGVPTAMVDLSDGLAGDACHLAAASGVAVLLVPELHPRAPGGEAALAAAHAAAGAGRRRGLRAVLHGPRGRVQPHEAAFRRAFGVRLSCVGRLGGGDGVWFVDAEGHRTSPGIDGWQHFGGET